MGMFDFFKAFGKAKAEDGINDVVKFLASVDPKAATTAQLNVLKEKRDDYGKRLVEARRALDVELSKTNAVQENIGKQEHALRILKTQHENGDPEARTIALRINKTLDELKEDLAVTLEEDRQAEEVVIAVQGLYDQMCDMLAGAKSELATAERRLEKAKATKEHQALMAEMDQAHESFGGLNVALDALRASAVDEEDAVELARMNGKKARKDDEVDVDAIIASATPKEEVDPFASLK